jgi:hypothetical protein
VLQYQTQHKQKSADHQQRQLPRQFVFFLIAAVMTASAATSAVFVITMTMTAVPAVLLVTGTRIGTIVRLCVTGAGFFFLFTVAGAAAGFLFLHMRSPHSII